MNDASLILPPIDFVKLGPLMQELFDVGETISHTFVHGGFMGQNYRVDTQKGVFFLKQYRNRLNTIIHEIKAAEEYFAKQGLPVILPIKDKYGREAFWVEGSWYSLFPFINGKSPAYGAVTAPIAQSLAVMLAKFHEAGARFTQRPFQQLRIGNRRKFFLEQVELVRILQQKPSRNPLEERILEILMKKAELVSRTSAIPQDIPLHYTCLLHGDFQYLNTFVNEKNEVTHVYDLERASMGPTAYEVTRSLIINCFDDGWGDQNFALGREYLARYREHYPMTFEELWHALRLYTYNIMHMTWLETRYVVFGVETQLEVFERHVRRLETLTTHDAENFCARVWKN